MDKDAARSKIDRQLTELQTVRSGSTSSTEFKKWRRNTELAIEYVFGKDTRHLADFTGINWTPQMYSMSNPGPAFTDAYARGIQSAQAVLQE